MMRQPRLRGSGLYTAAGLAYILFGWTMFILDDSWFLPPRYAGLHPFDDIWNIFGPVFMIVGLALVIPRWSSTPVWFEALQDFLAWGIGVIQLAIVYVSYVGGQNEHSAPVLVSLAAPYGIVLIITVTLRALGRNVR